MTSDVRHRGIARSAFARVVVTICYVLPNVVVKIDYERGRSVATAALTRHGGGQPTAEDDQRHRPRNVNPALSALVSP
jgi:hypothetical protein